MDFYFSKMICAEETYGFSEMWRFKPEERLKTANGNVGSKVRSHAKLRILSGEPPCSRVCVLSVCAVRVLLHRMGPRPRRVRRVIAAGVRPVVSVYALAVVWRCVGLARWQ